MKKTKLAQIPPMIVALLSFAPFAHAATQSVTSTVTSVNCTTNNSCWEKESTEYRTVNGCDAPQVEPPVPCTGFGLSVPASATILGVSVTFSILNQTGGPDGSTIQDVQLMEGGSAIAAKVVNQPISGDSPVVPATFGGSSDLWGTTLTPAIVDDPSFGIQITADRAGNRLFIVWNDPTLHPSITVWYTASPPAAAPPPVPAPSASAGGTCAAAGTTYPSCCPVPSPDPADCSYQPVCTSSGSNGPTTQVTTLPISTTVTGTPNPVCSQTPGTIQTNILPYSVPTPAPGTRYTTLPMQIAGSGNTCTGCMITSIVPSPTPSCSCLPTPPETNFTVTWSACGTGSEMCSKSISSTTWANSCGQAGACADNETCTIQGTTNIQGIGSCTAATYPGYCDAGGSMENGGCNGITPGNGFGGFTDACICTGQFW